jgi:hypothetical protein
MMKLLTLGLPVLASFFLLADNAQLKDIGKISIGVTAANLIALSNGKGETEKLNSEIEKLNKTLEQRLETVKVVDKKRKEEENQKNIAIQLASDLKDEYGKQLENQKITATQTQHNLEIQINDLRAKLREVSVVATSTVFEIVEKTYKDSYQKTFCLLDGWKNNYPELTEFFDNLEADIDKVKSWATKEIESYKKLETVDKLLGVGLYIQERIISRMADIRIKGYSTIIQYLKEITEDYVSQESVKDLVIFAGEELEAKKSEIEKIANEWIKSNEGHKQKYETEFTEAINQGKKGVEYIEGLQQKLFDLEAQLAELKRPRKFYPATREDLRAANLLIEYLESKKFILHSAYSKYHKYTAEVFFQSDQMLSISELNTHSEHLMRVCKTNAPVKFSNDDSGLIKADLSLATPEKVEKGSQFKPPTCRSVIEKSARGLLITGNPGNGKSSAMRAIGQWLGGIDSMRLALIPHAQDTESFEDAGYVVINDKERIYQAIAALDEEIKLRGQSTKKDHRYLIVCIDELGSIIKDAPDDLNVMEIIRQAAVEGRKLNIIVLLGNHSQTTKAIEMDSQYREAFVQLWLAGAATHKLNMPQAPQMSQKEIDWVRDQPYPVIVSINGKFTATQHPTHYPYNEYQDKGLPPIGVENWDSNTVVIGGMNYPAKRRKASKL